MIKHIHTEPLHTIDDLMYMSKQQHIINMMRIKRAIEVPYTKEKIMQLQSQFNTCLEDVKSDKAALIPSGIETLEREWLATLAKVDAEKKAAPPQKIGFRFNPPSEKLEMILHLKFLFAKLVLEQEKALEKIKKYFTTGSMYTNKQIGDADIILMDIVQNRYTWNIHISTLLDGLKRYLFSNHPPSVTESKADIKSYISILESEKDKYLWRQEVDAMVGGKRKVKKTRKNIRKMKQSRRRR
jgi:hypothetical protein